MDPSRANAPVSRHRSTQGAELSTEHYIRILWYRKWIVLVCFAVIAAGTAIWSSYLPDIYTSDTVILVDPQKVPDTYVKSTVTGDVRNRLGTLSQQILSATRLQKIIDNLNLYPEDRKQLAREDVITKMRNDISVNVVSDFGGSQDLQAFRISYSGRDPRLVAQVANELASLFIEENLKAREQQATGTSDFLKNQLQETRKTLEAHEAKLKDFKLKHIGEMPEQQTATLQILGQLQSQLQLVSESLSRAEQQKAYIQSMFASMGAAPVVDLDTQDSNAPRSAEVKPARRSQAAALRSKLSALLTRYSEEHPEVRRLKRQIEDEENRERLDSPAAPAAPPSAPPERAAPPVRRLPARVSNPVLESQLQTVEAEIAKHKQERDRLSRLVTQYHAKMEAIPVREQQITDLVRDYEISKSHYQQLLEKQLSAETATELEIRQKGERFTVLDPAQAAQRPSRPNRLLINGAGAIAGLGFGLLLALITEFLGLSITSGDQVTAVSGLEVLEIIPIIHTHADRMARRRRLVLGIASGVVVGFGCCVVLLYHYRDRFF
jgi:polysaccharide chain length determinant protein (PEP-CTERM system associated)